MMKIENIVVAIDSEIERLQNAKALLSGSNAISTRSKREALPKSSGVGSVRRKRILSPEALERIREGQRRRWAEAKRGTQ
jgi:hypothetical protein